MNKSFLATHASIVYLTEIKYRVEISIDLELISLFNEKYFQKL